MARTPDRDEGVRERSIRVRVTDVERAELVRVAREMGCTEAEAVRALPRLWDALTERQRERVRR